MATLSRSDIGSDFPLTILATSSDPLVATVAAAPLRLEAHQSSITFPITILNDLIFEGTQSVRLNFAVQDRAFEAFGLELRSNRRRKPLAQCGQSTGCQSRPGDHTAGCIVGYQLLE